MQPPSVSIDPKSFWADPYPTLANLRETSPVAWVPELNAVLLTGRDDIWREEKRIEVLSSEQPEGLMTLLMGQNMMRKDGEAHLTERKQMFTAVSPRTVQDVWLKQFQDKTTEVISGLLGRSEFDLVRDFAMPVSAHALCAMTGLTNMAPEEMDRVSQGMIDGCANYTGDPEVTARCHDCTASIDRHISDMVTKLTEQPNSSILSVLKSAGQSDAQISANIKLVISGGQNEPRDAIAGAIWALLSHPDQHALIKAGSATYRDAFEEYARWISPIGMSPREVAKTAEVAGFTLSKGTRVFLMFGSGNRDADHFGNPEAFDMTQDRSAAISFGAGPHFCAGAWASRALIGDVALPMFFDAFPKARLLGDTPFGGWAFRGPLRSMVAV